ncbi:MAG: gamma-glutamyltransferase family protein [Rhodospirillales bacterium]|nr:gamma-glutamyltransferase family protein [Rhodospirillales bacterium]
MRTAIAPYESMRPVVMGTRHAASAGHYLATEAAFQILEAGGNAVDAGVAGGLALGVLESEYVGIAGVAPILIYLAKTGEVITLDGVGGWPKAATSDYFQKNHKGEIPRGVLRSVVPGAPSSWMEALSRYGTMSFGEVSAAAIRFASEGFVMYPMMADLLAGEAKALAAWPSSAAVFLPGGRTPRAGEVFQQKDLGRTLQYMVDQERKALKAGGRKAGIKAARDAFYKGDIARTIDKFYRANGGLLTYDDLASYKTNYETPMKTRFAGVDVWGCGPWCQGPMFLQQLNILDGVDLKALGHNSAPYIHTLTEAIKLTAADREAYFGDPNFVKVPMAKLASKEYGKQRRDMIRPDRAFPDMPPAGVFGSKGKGGGGSGRIATRSPADPYDTSYVAVVDRHGNAFSGTPSDGNMMAPIVPGTGLVVSTRGYQSWADPRHPSSVAPGKRPRLTPNPALAMVKGKFVMPFGTPGHDVQTQAMLQTLCNMFVFGMHPQQAVEEPRFATYSFPSSATPHESEPGSLKMEGRISRDVGERLAKMGHKITWWPDRDQLAGSVCLVYSDLKSGVISAAADFRRSAYAVAS